MTAGSRVTFVSRCGRSRAAEPRQIERPQERRRRVVVEYAARVPRPAPAIEALEEDVERATVCERTTTRRDAASEEDVQRFELG